MSPRSSAQFGEMREEKKTLIMDVALEHFSDYGFHSTTISHLAKHAGISKGLLYNYFKSKEELLAAIINRSLTEIYSSFNPDHDSQPDTGGVRTVHPQDLQSLPRKEAVLETALQNNAAAGGIRTPSGEDQMPISVRVTPLVEFSENMIMLLADYFSQEKGYGRPGL